MYLSQNIVPAKKYVNQNTENFVNKSVEVVEFTTNVTNRVTVD